jgi:threonine dehydrogenase-like Zn-dependent dehydrogenase
MNNAHHLAIVRGEHGLACAPVPTLPLRHGEVRIDIDCVGVCGTDLQILNGTRPGAARILGHEGTGRVTEVAPGAPESLCGKQVVFNPVNPAAPGEVLGHSYDGLLQQRFNVPARLLPTLLLCPAPVLPLPQAVLAEPLATVVYGIELVRQVCELRTVAVVGAGPAGLLYALHARAAGASRVSIVHPSHERLMWAVGAGVIGKGEALLADDMAGRCAGDCDAVFLCTTRRGAPAGMRTALRLAKPGGCIDLVSGFPETCDEYRLVREARAANVCGATKGRRPHERYMAHDAKPVWLTGHRGTSAAHLAHAISLLGAQPDYYGRLITHIVPLEDAAATLTALSRAGIDRPRASAAADCVKVVVDVSDSILRRRASCA